MDAGPGLACLNERQWDTEAENTRQSIRITKSKGPALVQIICLGQPGSEVVRWCLVMQNEVLCMPLAESSADDIHVAV